MPVWNLIILKVLCKVTEKKLYIHAYKLFESAFHILLIWMNFKWD